MQTISLRQTCKPPLHGNTRRWLKLNSHYVRRVIGRVCRTENPHPRRRRAGNRKLSLPHIVLKGARYPSSRTALLIRRAQGDTSRYSLLMGVLFSGALGSLETCHASLGSPRISHRTTFDTDNAVRMSKISQKSGNRACASRFARVCCACSRERVSLHVVTLLPRGRRMRRRACPSINVNQPLNNDAPCKEDFIVLRREQSWRHNAAPFVLRGSALPSYPWTLGSVWICCFLHASFFFLLSLYEFCSYVLYEGCAFRKCFLYQQWLHARLYTWRLLPQNINDLEKLDAGRMRINLRRDVSLWVMVGILKTLTRSNVKGEWNITRKGCRGIHVCAREGWNGGGEIHECWSWKREDGLLRNGSW